MDREQIVTKQDSLYADAIDARLALLLIERPASTDRELADQLGISRQTVNRRRNSPTVQKMIRSTLKLPEEEMRRITAKALARLEALLDDEDPRIKLAATLAIVKLNSRLLEDNIGLW